MAVTPTLWIPADSGTVTATNSAVQRTEQNGVVRTQQNGTIRILQPNVIQGRIPTLWVAM